MGGPGINEKDCAFDRYDVIEVLCKIYNVVKHEAVMKKALELIETEKNEKYKKKYAGLGRIFFC